MFSKSLIITGAVLVLSHAHAADPAACETALDPISDASLLAAASDENPDAIVFEVGELEASFGGMPTASMNVLLPTPGAPVMPTRIDFPVCGSSRVSSCSASNW